MLHVAQTTMTLLPAQMQYVQRLGDVPVDQQALRW